MKKKKARVLVVDDNLDLCNGMAECIAGQGYGVHTATDGYQAKKLLDEIGFDLMLVDYKMNELDGISVIKAAKEENPAIKALLMTGSSNADCLIQDEHLESLVSEVISKPFDIGELLGKIGKLI